MSHFSRITTKINDLAALNVAVEKMGFRVEQHNSNCRKREFVIKLPSAYDIAVIKDTKEGNYNFEADFYSSFVSRYVGDNCNLLMQKYAAEKAKIEALKNGLIVTEKTENEFITLTMTDPDTGGQIIVNCLTNGETRIKTIGFQGSTCMKIRGIEEVLGTTETLDYTDEFFCSESVSVDEVEVVHTTNY